MYECCKGKSQFTAKYWVELVYTLHWSSADKKTADWSLPRDRAGYNVKPKKRKKNTEGGVYIRRNLSSDNRLTVCYIYIYRYIATSCMEGFPISQSLSLLSSFLFSLFMYVKNFFKKKRKREFFLNWCKITTSFTLIESCDTEHVRDRQTAFALIAVREKGPTAGVPSWTDWKKKEDRSRNPIRMPSGTI